MASGINFKLYDPVAQLVATGGGSGGGLPLTGGTLTGNLVLTAPAKVVQCQNPTGACDVVNLQYLQSVLPIFPLSVSQGGTGASSLTGYIKGNGTAPFTASPTIPVADVTGAVRSVNSQIPDGAGNVVVPFGSVSSGTLAARPAQPQPNGNIYIVSGDPTPANNGLTYISDGTTWNQVISPAGFGPYDARYVAKAGDTMTGNLVMQAGTKVTLTDAPVAATDAVNKAYVDSNVGMAFGGWKKNNNSFATIIPPNTTLNAMSGGFDLIGNSTWTGADGVTMAMAGSGIVTITNTKAIPTFYICTFYGTGLSNLTAANNAEVYFRFYDETLAQNINNQEQVLRSVSTNIIPGIGSQQFNNSAIVVALVTVPANSSKQISVKAQNKSTTDSVVLNSVNDVCQLIIFRQA